MPTIGHWPERSHVTPQWTLAGCAACLGVGSEGWLAAMVASRSSSASGMKRRSASGICCTMAGS